MTRLDPRRISAIDAIVRNAQSQAPTGKDFNDLHACILKSLEDGFSTDHQYHGSTERVVRARIMAEFDLRIHGPLQYKPYSDSVRDKTPPFLQTRYPESWDHLQERFCNTLLMEIPFNERQKIEEKHPFDRSYGGAGDVNHVYAMAHRCVEKAVRAFVAERTQGHAAGVGGGRG